MTILLFRINFRINFEEIIKLMIYSYVYSHVRNLPQISVKKRSALSAKNLKVTLHKLADKGTKSG